MMYRTLKRGSMVLGTLVGGVLLAGCPNSEPGVLTNEIAADLSFVADSDAVYLTHEVNRYGLTRINMDGSGRQEVFSERYRPEGAAFFTELRALSDEETNLYIQRSAGEEPERIEALDERVSDVAVHPDGTQIAVSRHADYSLPSSEQVNDDRIFLIDVNDAGSASPIVINELEPERDERVLSLEYSRDGASLYATTESTFWRIDTSTGEREDITGTDWPDDDIYPETAQRERCESLGATLDVREDEGIFLNFDDGDAEELVGVEGRETYPATAYALFGAPTFSASCATVAFMFEDAAWVVDVESKVVGRLGDARGLSMAASDVIEE